ncbi:nitroreductase family protein [Algibacter lectus]|uniref:nitroreductase family protein n=1 Tax=Algibacter lectus TaxID=221126 RepID=UPI0026ED95EE|nr:nitroreductase family protein [Algibacter lectus]MDO7136430.1 nitroreductase family protein [Algibacter lectus]
MSNLIQKLKSKIDALLFWQTPIGEILNKIYDLRLFYKYSFKKEKFKSKNSHKAYLTKQYHIIEKGMALPNPRLGFGVAKIETLIKLSKSYLAQFPEDELTLAIKSCLKEYILFNKTNNVDITTPFYKNIENFIHGTDYSKNTGGVRNVSKLDLAKKTNIDYASFAKSRFSIRDFDKSDLKISQIIKAVDIAKHAPSVCNRQSWKANIYTEKKQILNLLKIQGGNNGFTESINKLIIVTTDTKSFTIMESNQVYIDGGIFSMSLILALHSLEIGACCLNTCFPFTKEKKVKSIGEIPENERLIMMIGIGNLKDNYKVAISSKKKIEEIIKIS